MISSSRSTTPMPGSMITHCSPSPGATTQQLVAVTSDGKPATNTGRRGLHSVAIGYNENRTASLASPHGGHLNGFRTLPRSRRCQSGDPPGVRRPPGRDHNGVPTNKQRREAARRHLERQLQRRIETDVKRKRRNLIVTVVGSVVVVVVIVSCWSWVVDDDKKSKAARRVATASAPIRSSAAASSSAAAPPPQTAGPCGYSPYQRIPRPRMSAFRPIRTRRHRSTGS